MIASPANYSPRRKDRPVPSKTIREINADIALKHLSLDVVARRAKVNYRVLSAILSGSIVRPRHIPAIRDAVASFPTPRN